MVYNLLGEENDTHSAGLNPVNNDFGNLAKPFASDVTWAVHEKAQEQLDGIEGAIHKALNYGEKASEKGTKIEYFLEKAVAENEKTTQKLLQASKEIEDLGRHLNKEESKLTHDFKPEGKALPHLPHPNSPSPSPLIKALEKAIVFDTIKLGVVK